MFWTKLQDKITEKGLNGTQITNLDEDFNVSHKHVHTSTYRKIPKISGWISTEDHLQESLRAEEECRNEIYNGGTC